MRVSTRIRWLCWAMTLAFPLSLFAQDSGAILHAQGGAWVNGNEAKDSAAIFAGDVLETKAGFSAELTLEGSSVMIGPDSVVKFQGNWLELDHGNVSVATSRNFKVVVHCLSVVPVANDATTYEVVHVNQNVHVSARKLDVNVNVANGHRKTPTDVIASQSGSQGGSVKEGEDRNYNESDLCGGALKPNGFGTPLNAKWIALGAGAGGGILIWLLEHGGGSTPLSNSQP